MKVKNINNIKITIFTNLGATLEYYDYIIFSYITPIISLLFFTETSDPFLGTLQMILLFVIGNFSRIIGSFTLGFLSTRYGKLSIMLLSIYLMALSTIIIGFLPTYSRIGIMAPILLIVCRFVQAVAYCVEVPSSSLFIFDYYKGNRGQILGFLMASTTLGCVLATFIMYLLSKYCSSDDILSYMWRVPFLFGGVVGIFGIYIRRSLLRNYEHSQYNINEILQSFRQDSIKILESLSLLCLPASLIIIYIYLQQFFPSDFIYSKSEIYLVSTIGLIFSIFVAILSGIMIDRNVKNYNLYCYYGFFILYPSIWLALNLQSFFVLVIFSLIFQFFTTNFMVSALYKINSILAKNNIKSILIIIIYNMAFVLCSFIPLLAKKYNSVFIAMVVPCVLNLIIILFSKYTRHSLTLT
jgi:MFS family permease